ncbi:unnamed protein product [Caretta caretta]
MRQVKTYRVLCKKNMESNVQMPCKTGPHTWKSRSQPDPQIFTRSRKIQESWWWQFPRSGEAICSAKIYMYLTSSLRVDWPLLRTRGTDLSNRQYCNPVPGVNWIPYTVA